MIVTNDGDRVLNASAQSRAVVSESYSEKWCIKYPVASSVKQIPLVSARVLLCVCEHPYLRHPPSFVSVTLVKLITNESVKARFSKTK